MRARAADFSKQPRTQYHCNARGLTVYTLYVVVRMSFVALYTRYAACGDAKFIFDVAAKAKRQITVLQYYTARSLENHYTYNVYYCRIDNNKYDTSNGRLEQPAARTYRRVVLGIRPPLPRPNNLYICICINFFTFKSRNVDIHIIIIILCNWILQQYLYIGIYCTTLICILFVMINSCYFIEEMSIQVI